MDRLTMWIFMFSFLSLVTLSCKQGKVSDDGNAKDSLHTTLLDNASEGKRAPSVLHFWDDYNFGDTNLIHNPNVSEQALVDFLDLLRSVDQPQAAIAIKTVFDKAAINEKVFAYFREKSESYLYDPNSPMRSDVYYQPVLEYLIAARQTSDTDRERYKTRLTMVRKNMPGSVANNFNYTDLVGESKSIHEQFGMSKLLVFYDPNCPHCRDILKQMAGSPHLNALIHDKALKVLAVCPVGDVDGWKAYQQNIPDNWTNGFVKEEVVIHKGLYDLRAFPTIFLIDNNNNVILKDTELEQIVNVFRG